MPTASAAKGVQIMNVRISEMFVDEKYQRPLKQSFVQKIADNFDEKMLGVVVCNRRDSGDGEGKYALVDGQHRMEGAVLKGRKQLPAVVFEIDAEAEGALFTALQKERRPVTSIERHKALVYSKDDLALRIDRMTKQHGFKIQEGSITSIQAITYAASRGWSLENYGKALKVMKEAWPQDIEKLTAFEVVMGLWMFFQRADIKATTQETIDAMFDYVPRAIVRDTKLNNANDEKLSRLGAAGWTIAKQFNRHHKRRGVQQVAYDTFTSGYRVKLGQRTMKEQGKVNPGQFGAHRSEFTSPFSSGDE